MEPANQRLLRWVFVFGLIAPAARADQSLQPAFNEPTAAAVAWAARVGLESHREQFAHEGGPPVEIHFFLKPGRKELASRIVGTTMAALSRVADWYGPYHGEPVTIIDAPWDRGLTRAWHPGLMIVSSRWIEPATDMSLERALIGGIARQYWSSLRMRDEADAWFKEGVVLYSGERAINDVLEGRHFDSRRYFGGFVPYSIRSLQLSRRPADPRPRVRRFAELEDMSSTRWPVPGVVASAQARQAALALHTLERYIGWPALEQALHTFRVQVGSASASPADFVALVGEQRGVDLTWFFAEAYRFPARFDYGIEAFSSSRQPEGQPAFVTTLRLRRYGDAVFSGTSKAKTAVSAGARALAVDLSFADGSGTRAWWDGREAQLELLYESAAPALRASVDPDAMLLLDADRTNNTIVLQPSHRPLGARLVLNWMVWLQDLVLTYTSLS